MKLNECDWEWRWLRENCGWKWMKMKMNEVKRRWMKLSTVSQLRPASLASQLSQAASHASKACKQAKQASQARKPSTLAAWMWMRVKVDEGEWRGGSMKIKAYEGEGCFDVNWRCMKVYEDEGRKNPKLKWNCFGNDLIAKTMFFVRKVIVTLETKEVLSAALVRERWSCRGTCWGLAWLSSLQAVQH